MKSPEWTDYSILGFPAKIALLPFSGFIGQTHTSNIFHKTSHHGFGGAIAPKSGPVAGSKATQTHCGYFHCQFP